MDTNTLVMEQIDEGERLLGRLSGEGIPVRAACWANSAEEDRWSLYIATSVVDVKGLTGAYRDVYRVLRSLGGGWVTDSDIKLVGENNPIAREMIDLLHRHPGRSPVRSRRTILGAMPIHEVYLYPQVTGTGQSAPEKRRLKKDVEQIMRPPDVILTEEERDMRAQIVSSGVCLEDADRWIRQNRQKAEWPPIPAGTVVMTWVAAHWGGKTNDDPDPLLIVETQDGARGLVMKRDTEPV